MPGRAFRRRLYNLTANRKGVMLKQHHHVRVRAEDKLDLRVWLTFLTKPDIYCKPFVEFGAFHIEEIKMYSDASRNFSKGFGAWCENSWLQGFWDKELLTRYQPSIEYLELYAVVAAVLAWIGRYKNRKVRLFCDNLSVCYMVNNSMSNCRHCMILVRILVLAGLMNNVRIFAKHVKTKSNGRADALSRGQFSRFWRLSPPCTDYVRTEIPREIWPMSHLLPKF